MSQSEFALVCGVSAMAISKHKANGYLAFKGKLVDAARSLELLDGHLDEVKRRAAIARLAAEEALPAPAAPPSAIEVPAPIEEEGGRTSWVAEKNRAEAQMKLLDLYERQGQLIDAAEISAAIDEAIGAYWSEMSRRERLDADEIASALKLDADQARVLRAELHSRTRRLRADFAEAMHAAAAGLAPESRDVA